MLKVYGSNIIPHKPVFSFFYKFGYNLPKVIDYVIKHSQNCFSWRKCRTYYRTTSCSWIYRSRHEYIWWKRTWWYTLCFPIWGIWCHPLWMYSTSVRWGESIWLLLVCNYSRIYTRRTMEEVFSRYVRVFTVFINLYIVKHNLILILRLLSPEGYQHNFVFLLV